jgi:multicomponent Na+:H+ antiporter subunit E
MTLGLLNLLLALGWCAVVGSFTLVDLAVGFAVGYLTLWLVRPLYGPTRYFERFLLLPGLVLFFLGELLLSSLRVAWDVITPRLHSRPGIVAVPLDLRGDVEITVLANLVSLTPGTLSLEVSEDRKTLYVHAMFADPPEAVRQRIKDGLERRIMEIMR